MATLQDLQGDLDSINADYANDFAGQSRASREVAKMESLVKRTRTLIQNIGKLPAAVTGPEVLNLQASAAEQLTLFESEREAIVAAKKGAGSAGEAPAFAILATSANIVFSRYTRHFAGKARETRDLGLMEEMVDDLGKIRSDMTAEIARKPREEFRADRKIVEDNLALYQKERTEVETAQESGTPADREGRLAQVANDQFAVYRLQFAGKDRRARRPALLQRMIRNLERIQGAMKKLGKETLEHNEANIGIVTSNLEMYRGEIIEIRKAREGTSMVDIMGLLGDSANECFAEYREGFAGKNRTTVDLDLLDGICDKLDELYRQMRDLGRATKNDTNSRNMEIVAEQLSAFLEERRLIAEIQQKSS